LRRLASVKDRRIPSTRGKIEKRAMMRRVGRRRARPLFSRMIRGLTSISCQSEYVVAQKKAAGVAFDHAREPAKNE